jgi:hypothetical protein
LRHHGVTAINWGTPHPRRAREREEVFWVSDHCGDPPTRRRYVPPSVERLQISHQVDSPLPHVISNSSVLGRCGNLNIMPHSIGFPPQSAHAPRYAFDPIPVLAAIVRKLFGGLIRSAWRGPTLASIGVELQLPEVEFVHLDHCFRRANCYAFAFGRGPTSFTPSTLAFCRVAPSLRLSLRATTLVLVFSRTSVFKRRTSSFVHGRGFLVAFAIAVSPNESKKDRTHVNSRACPSPRGRRAAARFAITNINSRIEARAERQTFSLPSGSWIP